ncbi:hypothetical protein BKA66DRAFT_448285 [Pyrenochaeta sp. MPI-SDFR-AT-0127]|nr:hypothetical protein BKA66DRAFT_448285 [Pyrenochaeta sp. MPI-SDFR-AT-0127]
MRRLQWRLHHNHLSQWQNLCVDVGVAKFDHVPKSVTACKKALRPVRVNICDLLDYRRNPDIPLLRFSTHRAFCLYTQEQRIFSKEIGKRDGVIQGTLRRI